MYTVDRSPQAPSHPPPLQPEQRSSIASSTSSQPSAAPSAAPVRVSKAAATATTTTTRNVRLSDATLLHMALNAVQAVDWEALRSDPVPGMWTPTKASKRVSRRSTGSTVYTRQDHSFAVRAHTAIPCSLQELTLALKTIPTEEILQVLYEKAFVSAKVVHTVPTERKKSIVVADTSDHDVAFASDLFVKTAAFGKKSKALFGSDNEEWCYIDFMQRVNATTFRKTMLSIHPDNLLAGNGEDIADTHVREVVSGFLFEEADDGKSIRVAYSGEHFYEVSGHGASKWKRAVANRATKMRLVRLAESIDRLHLMVRRRRLGVQTLVDHINVSSSNSGCTCCKRSFLLTRKKVCNLCGYYVCEKCSDMEDREVHAKHSGQPVMSSIRVCDKCIARVDHCSFVNVALDDTAPPQIVPDSSPARASMTTGAMLTNLLQETLVDAPESKKTAVLSVIKHLVKQDSPTAVSDPVVLTPESTPTQHFAVLQSTLTDPPLPLDQCGLANTQQRSYLIDHSDDPEVSPPHPIPASEAKRLEIVRSSSLTALENVTELDIICSLISKELGCMGAMVSVSEENFFHVVATNIEALPAKMFPRNEGFCSRTIMGDKPMLVPHPEADIRFNYILPVKHLGISFYCGFPLFAEDFTVLGSLCCLGHESRKLTQSQFTVGKKLADTASKILQYQVKQRQSLGTTGADLEGLAMRDGNILVDV